MERKRYIPPDPRDHVKGKPLPPIEKVIEATLKEMGLPPVKKGKDGKYRGEGR